MATFTETFSSFVLRICSIGLFRHRSSSISQEKMNCEPQRAHFEWKQTWRMYSVFCCGVIFSPWLLQPSTTFTQPVNSILLLMSGVKRYALGMLLLHGFCPACSYLTNQKDSCCPHLVSLGTYFLLLVASFTLLFNPISLSLLNWVLHIAQGQVVTCCDISALY